jgi:hypothetical protein
MNSEDIHTLRRNIDQANLVIQEQARLLGSSGSSELKLMALLAQTRKAAAMLHDALLHPWTDSQAYIEFLDVRNAAIKAYEALPDLCQHGKPSGLCNPCDYAAATAAAESAYKDAQAKLATNP